MCSALPCPSTADPLRARHDHSARLGAITIKNLVFPEWWLLAPLPLCFALLALEFVLRFHRLMGAPRTRRHEATSVG
jgi:TRAP-type C4-dicarboxylate transport system permease small subunit